MLIIILIVGIIIIIICSTNVCHSPTLLWLECPGNGKSNNHAYSDLQLAIAFDVVGNPSPVSDAMW